jgi:hypothetical protein
MNSRFKAVVLALPLPVLRATSAAERKLARPLSLKVIK